MRFSKKQLLLIIALPTVIELQAQTIDSIPIGQRVPGAPAVNQQEWKSPSAVHKTGVKSFAVPALLVIYGAASLKSDHLKTFNYKVKEKIGQDEPKTHIDNYLLYAPAVAVYGLNALGIKGRHNFRDRTIIYLLSNAMVTSTVFGIKKLTHELRPDGTDFYSFPSGHTAEAFASAEFLRQEYKDVSPWYGIAGYLAAGATGAMRMYNNRHWMSDVLAGAGVGIASTKLAYWMYPAIKRALFKERPTNTMFMPYYQHKGGGIAMVYHLN